jgi:cyclopropane fatty-acyl-phospholipid synthase-like methyltransferase
MTSGLSSLKAGAKVADVGCGHGASTIVMAKAYPKSIAALAAPLHASLH